MDYIRKDQIRICLDEIEASFIRMGAKNVDKESFSKYKSWVRLNKGILKEANYKGKVPRQSRLTV